MASNRPIRRSSEPPRSFLSIEVTPQTPDFRFLEACRYEVVVLRVPQVRCFAKPFALQAARMLGQKSALQESCKRAGAIVAVACCRRSHSSSSGKRFI